MNSASFDKRADRRVVFKCENLQHGGAFKYRGALNAILPLALAGNVSAVATHSSGNHGTAGCIDSNTSSQQRLMSS